MLRSLTARILLAFAAVMVTFTVVMAVTVTYMDEVRDEMQMMQTVYLPLALATKDLARKQQELVEYVTDNLASETSQRRIATRVNAFRQAREHLMARVTDTLAGRGQAPVRHWPRLDRTELSLREVSAAVAAVGTDYAVLLTDARTLRVEDVAAAQTRLAEAERGVAQKTNALAEEQARVAATIARNLVFNEERLRWYTLVLSAGVLLVGLLVSIWIAGSMRSILRLRDAARHVAAGRYDHRIDERGPSEVRDLAQEFNLMSARVQDREHEVVRTARLAAVGRMAATITHEIRNPLASIALNTELLEEDLTEAGQAEARELCRAISKEVDRLTAITEEYLQFSRLPVPKRAVEDLSALASATCAFLREDASQRGAELVVVPMPAVEAYVDANQLRQCLINLVRNALEALTGRPNGVVKVMVEAVGARARLIVEDNGPGIPDAAAARLFDAFYTTKPGGSGLGLALTQQIVRDHEGTVAVESVAPHGARFVVELPARAA